MCKALFILLILGLEVRGVSEADFENVRDHTNISKLAMRHVQGSSEELRVGGQALPIDRSGTGLASVFFLNMYASRLEVEGVSDALVCVSFLRDENIHLRYLALNVLNKKFQMGYSESDLYRICIRQFRSPDEIPKREDGVELAFDVFTHRIALSETWKELNK